MFLIQYDKGQFINAEELVRMDICNESGFVIFNVKNNNRNIRVEKDYEESFLNEFKNLDDNNPGNKLTKHNYK
tara:strand:+ start:216 stop:434 length:219 start_codon:yes stop_codon:yes gene_type:complete